VKQLYILFFLLVGLVYQTSASEIHWLKIYPKFIYQDLNTACSNELSKTIYLALEVEENQVNAAMFHSSPDWPTGDKVKFSSEELAGIELFEDESMRIWLKRLPLSIHLTSWALMHSSGRNCPPQELSSVEPSVVLKFEHDGIQQGILVSHSQTTGFKGEREDGRPYQAKLRFTQQQYGLSTVP